MPMGSKFAFRTVLMLLCLFVVQAVRKGDLHEVHAVEHGAAATAASAQQDHSVQEHVQQGQDEESAKDGKWGFGGGGGYSCRKTRDCKSIGPYCYCSGGSCHC